MNVATILQYKGGNVVTTRPGSSVAEIVSLLCDARIGAVVISSDHVRVEGIVSERDIMRALAQYGSDALSMTAENIMTRDVVTCTPDDIAGELMAVMTAGRFRHIPVCEEGALVGIISIGDVVRVRVDEVEHEAEALRTYVTQG